MDCVLYIHGKGGSADEAEHYKPLFPAARVLGLDYRAGTPWEAMEEFPALYDDAVRDASSVTVIANSIGAYFTMLSLAQKPIDRALFISPVVDMRALILRMTAWAGVTLDALEARREIETDFGETLSWDYYRWVEEHPVRWTIPTRILCGSGDTLVPREEIEDFARQTGAPLTVMEGGEHWFHTPEQMAFLDGWIRGAV